MRGIHDPIACGATRKRTISVALENIEHSLSRWTGGKNLRQPQRGSGVDTLAVQLFIALLGLYYSCSITYAGIPEARTKFLHGLHAFT